MVASGVLDDDDPHALIAIAQPASSVRASRGRVGLRTDGRPLGVARAEWLVRMSMFSHL